MPDIETLPLDKLPPLAVTKRDAEWEQTFTSLSGRYWERQDQATVAHAANVQARADANLQERIMTDQTAQNAYRLSQELPLKVAEHDLQMKKGLMDLEHEQELHPLKLQTEEARTARLLSQDREAVKKARLNENLAIQSSMDNEAFMDNMAASNARPGSQEFVDELVRNRERFPGSRVVFNDLFKAHAGSDDDPEEVFKTRQTALAAAGPNTTVTTKLPGGGTMTDRPTFAADRTFASTQLGRAQARRDRASKAEDEEGTKQANEDIELWSGKLAEVDAANKGSATTDPRNALAQKALADPNASEAHKAAARRLLGQ